MMKKLINHILIALFVTIVASCSSTRHAKMPMVGSLTGSEYVEKVIVSAPHWDVLSGKTSLELNLGKKESLRVNASLRIRRNEAIQLSVTPVLGIEVARLELTPDGLLLVDRINKRFVKASFMEVSDLLHVDVNFHILQSLFLNEVFLPGKPKLGVEDVSSFLLTNSGKQSLIQPKKTKRINYKFLTSSENGLLEKTRIGLRSTAFSLDWDYSDFSDLEGRLFPRRINVSLKGTTDNYALNLKMSRLSVNGKWSGNTRLSSRYKEMSLQEILKALLKL